MEASVEQGASAQIITKISCYCGPPICIGTYLELKSQLWNHCRTSHCHYHKQPCPRSHSSVSQAVSSTDDSMYLFGPSAMIFANKMDQEEESSELRGPQISHMQCHHPMKLGFACTSELDTQLPELVLGF